MVNLVSIIIPVFNKEKFLENCLMSIVCQTYKDIEVICVNDCSKDTSLDILEMFRKTYDNIMVVNNIENMGPGYSRNVGIDSCHGKYIYFLDADDQLKKNAIEELVAYMGANEDLECIFFDTEMDDKESVGQLPIQDFKAKSNKIMSGRKFFTDTYNRRCNSNAVWRQFWRKEALIRYELRFPNYRLAEDGLFSIQAYMLLNKVAYYPKALHKCIRNSGSLSNTYNSTRILTTFKIYCEYIDILKNWKLDEQTYDAFTQYVNEYLDKLRRITLHQPDFNISDLQNEDDIKLFQELLKQSPQARFYDFDKQLLSKLRKNGVYIYGAGSYGSEVYEYLKKNNIITHALIISKRNDRLAVLDKIAVYELAEIKDKDIEIVVGTSKVNSEVIIKNLQEKNFKNIHQLKYK